jgi:hypothetical protein
MFKNKKNDTNSKYAKYYYKDSHNHYYLTKHLIHWALLLNRGLEEQLYTKVTHS